jgi:hypothetical protein
MRKLFFAAAAAAVVGLFAPMQANAQGPIRRVFARVAAPVAMSVAMSRECGTSRPIASAVFGVVRNIGQGIAQRKAEQHAQRQIGGHLGGAINGTHEGTGWSTRSADDAVRNCCYWGQLPVSEVGVSRGSNGVWYAVVHYGTPTQATPATLPNYQPVPATPAVTQASYQPAPVVISNVGTAHVSPRTVWRPATSIAATCTGPNCNAGR